MIAGVTEEQLIGRRIVDSVAFSGEAKLLVSLCIVENLNIRGVPNVSFSANLFRKGFNNIPIVIAFKLIAVSPDIKKPRSTRAFFVDQFIRMSQKLLAVVVAGWPKTKPI